MTAKEKDIRITKTQRALAASLLSLLARQSFQRITVNDICQEAMVSRSAFYSHFADKYQLLRFCMEELRGRLGKDHKGLEPVERVAASLRAMAENAPTLRNLFLADADTELREMFMGHFVGIVAEMIEKNAEKAEHAASAELAAVYCASGITAMTIWWIKGGFSVPVEEMAAAQVELLGNTLRVKRRRGD